MNTQKSSSQIKWGALISYVALGVTTLIGLLYTPWMVDKIGRANYGLYTLAISLINIFLLDFGLGSAVSRFVSKYRAEGNQQGVNNIMGAIYKLYIAIDILIVVTLVVVYFFIDSIYVKLTPAEIEQFRILYILVAFSHAISFPLSPLNGLLNAYEKFVQLKLCTLCTKVATVAAVVIALRFSNSVTTVVGLNVLFELLGLLVKFTIVRTNVPVRVNFRQVEKGIYRTLFSFTVWTAIISLMQRFTHSFAPSVLAMTSNTIEIALYAPAVTLEGYFYTLATAVNGLFLPRISRYIADKKEDGILNLMIKVGQYQVVVLGLVFVGFVCVGQEFMVNWMGPDFRKTYYLAMLILLPTLISSTQQIAHTTVIAKKLIKYQAICMCVTGVLGLALSYVVSMYVGALGVCIGTAVTSLANISYMNTVYKRKAGIDVFTFYKKCYLKAIPCYAITIVLGLLITNRVPLAGWAGLFIKAGLVAVLFGLTMWFGYISKAERQQLIQKIKRRK
ncbi:MAG: lipopolysaccharide biosynthesis protein [Clostridia bacterium]|nr:lipopolysaccharide biosynthesis protein [Clostridia bacterium]